MSKIIKNDEYSKKTSLHEEPFLKLHLFKLGSRKGMRKLKFNF